ncbi:hypothetical protein [Mycoplasmopsis bovirhinis]|uniref:hypothetical protein n=1 Tax=Mycoplasmopsis bovirhinis TaxID=29553 RepID=UPI00101C4AB0|nr:hypothetical protein [Mycoplasmopsis bovirhinis]
MDYLLSTSETKNHLDNLLEITKIYHEIKNKLPKSSKVIESKNFSMSYLKLSEVFGLLGK